MSETRTSTDRATYRFETRDAAWTFMRSCEALGIPAGFPGLTTYTVDVLLASWIDRVDADSLANGAPIVSYEFRSES